VLDLWFANGDPLVLDRLCVFAKTGADGSMAAFWIDEAGVQKIVHLGSGSGSDLVCVLASDAVDFLRIIAIGYDEICWREELASPPNQGSFHVHPNTEYQEWVVKTFDVSIPRTATEIVKHPDRMDDPNPTDAFARWVAANVG
jgi:hypothetical protein